MKNQRALSLAILALAIILLTSSTPLFATITIDPNGTGATDIDPADPATWDSSTYAYVGENRSGELLVDGASMLETYRVYLGDEPSSNGTVTITGTGSAWTSERLTVGNGGDGTLRIADGGAFHSSYATIADDSDSTGIVTVNESGSIWTNGYGITVGGHGDGTLNITGGAKVECKSGTISNHSDSTSIVTVNGVGSTWINSDYLHVGGFAGSGTLNVTGGAEVRVESGMIGYFSNATGTVTVDGAGSTWNNSSDFSVGYFGSGALNITGGAEVNSESSTIGYFSDSTGIVTVTGAGSTWNNSSDLTVGNLGNATLNIENGGLVKVAGETSVGEQGVIIFNGGTLHTVSLSADNTNLSGTGTLILPCLIAEDALVIDSPDDLTGYSHQINTEPNQNIAVNYDLTENVSELGAGATGVGSLTITNGIAVSSAIGYIGRDAAATGTVTIDGAGSVWSDSGHLYVGEYGSGTLHVTNGGTSNNKNAYLGYYADSTGTVNVDGAGSTWANDGYLYVGGNEGSGTLNVTDGGVVRNTYSIIGNFSGSDGTVKVDGNGSTWTNDGYLKIGSSSHGTLDITNGGAVSNDYSFIASSSGSTGTVTVDGNDSTWTSEGSLYVGYGGVGTLNITNGGTVNISDPSNYGYSNYIGHQAGSTGSVTVEGQGSTWTGGNLYVGNAGNGTLSITGSGVVSSRSSYIGDDSGSTGVVTVDGSGSTWNNSFLVVGNDGDGTLNIVNGATVSVEGSTYLAWKSGSTGSIHFENGGALTTETLFCSAAHLTGTGTIDTYGLVADLDLVLDHTHGPNQTFTIDQQGQNVTVNLDVSGANKVVEYFGAGYKGDGSLTIQDGIAITSQYGYLGYDVGSHGTATVDGIGSSWTNELDLHVGREGGGTLNITNGATVVVNRNTYVSCKSGSPGAVYFSNGGTLSTNAFYGSPSQFFGTGTINTNGLVSDVDLIFDETHGLNKVLTFDQQGQNVTVNLNVNEKASVLGVGYSGDGSISISDGLVVSSYSAYLGYRAGSKGTATVDGIGSTWKNDTLAVGEAGNGTLDITNGGTVTNDMICHIGSRFGSSGTLRVDGSGSTFTLNATYGYGGLFIGCSGNGTLTVTNGGMVHNNTQGVGIGYALNAVEPATTSTGTAIVDGNGSTWTNSCSLALYNGELRVTNGGTITSEYSHLGRYAPGTGTITIDGDGSTWTNSASISIGGNGTLAITNGGAVHCGTNDYDRSVIGDSEYGDSFGGTGVVTVDGIGSTWTNGGSLFVGDDNYDSYTITKGELKITNGGTVSNQDAYIAYSYRSPSTVTVDGNGSTWTSTNLYVSCRDNGTLSIANGGTVVSEDAHISYNYGATGTVTVDGVGSTWKNDYLYVGNQGVSGMLEITEGGLVSVAERLSISSSSINMSTGGMLALFGEADDSIMDFLGLANRTSGINYWNDSITDWAPITDATLGTDYTLEYLLEGDLAGYTLLTVGTVPVAGDANGDGVVDGSDVTILAGNWQVGVDDGQTATWAMGDFNGDGKVDGSDVTILAGNWQYGVSTATTAVPEPGCVVLLLMSFVTGLAWLRRKQSL